MTKSQQLHAEADKFAARAAQTKARTARNTLRSLEQSVRTLADAEDRREAGRSQPANAR